MYQIALVYRVVPYLPGFWTTTIIMDHPPKTLQYHYFWTTLQFLDPPPPNLNSPTTTDTIRVPPSDSEPEGGPAAFSAGTLAQARRKIAAIGRQRSACWLQPRLAPVRWLQPAAFLTFVPHESKTFVPHLTSTGTVCCEGILHSGFHFPRL